MARTRPQSQPLMQAVCTTKHRYMGVSQATEPPKMVCLLLQMTNFG